MINVNTSLSLWNGSIVKEHIPSHVFLVYYLHVCYLCPVCVIQVACRLTNVVWCGVFCLACTPAALRLWSALYCWSRWRCAIRWWRGSGNSCFLEPFVCILMALMVNYIPEQNKLFYYVTVASYQLLLTAIKWSALILKTSSIFVTDKLWWC